MPPSPPKPSARLLRAAAAERAELDRHRARLVRERESLMSELARIEQGLSDLDERRRLLDRLAPSAAPAAPAPAETGAAEGTDPQNLRLLRGPEIRERAVELLVRAGDAEALHYRAWYDLLRTAGYGVIGKDPLAVFLTQLGRSPVVRKGTQAGVYELDRGAVPRLRGDLERLRQELLGLTAGRPATADLREIRARREALTVAIAKVERALEEAERVLGQPAAAPMSAAG